MTTSPDSRGWYSLERDIDAASVERLRQIDFIEKLSVTRIPLLTVKQARRISTLRAQHLWLWSDVTRRAMKEIIQMPGLRVLDVLCIKGPGKLDHFGKATTLETFRANHYMTEADLLEVTQSSRLVELGAQGAELTPKSVAAILALPCLTSLDLESTRFNDSIAKKVSRSQTIESLDLGATHITGMGLGHLAQMKQLRCIDLWATDITERDLPLLQDMPNLEYLSLGNYDHCPQLDAEKVCNVVLELPRLKKLWLDGIRLNEAQQNILEEKLESLRVTTSE